MSICAYEYIYATHAFMHIRYNLTPISHAYMYAQHVRMYAFTYTIHAYTYVLKKHSPMHTHVLIYINKQSIPTLYMHTYIHTCGPGAY